MRTAVLAALLAIAMLATVAALRRLPDTIPDLTVGKSMSNGNPWMRTRGVRA